MPQTDLTDYPEKDSDNGGEIDRPDRNENDAVPDSDDTTANTTESLTPTGDELPTADAVPSKCLSFTVSAPFAHFRKVETSSTRLSYGLPPRTTVSGLLAAMLGLERDSYYEVMDLTHSAVSINVTNPIRQYQMPIKHRNTDKNVYETAGNKRTLKIQYPQHPEEIDEGKHHQRVAHTMLRDAAYRINVWLSTDELYDELKSLLENGESHYTPSLGLSECIASIEYHGEHTPDPVSVAGDEIVAIDSAIPQSSATIPAGSDVAVTTEQVPAAMQRVETPLPSRRTTAYTAYQYQEDGEAVPATTDVAASVDGNTVIFR
jgi:CRISPR-associated protein Cas5h